MSHTPHELHEEFPELADKITRDETVGCAFRQAGRGPTTRSTVPCTGPRPTSSRWSQFSEEEMRKKRAALKDELYRMLKA